MRQLLFFLLLCILLGSCNKCDAGFTVSNTTVNVNDNVKFSASPGCGKNDTYQWDYGDGNGGTGMDVTHAYTTAGTYTVKLTVGDKESTATVVVQ